MKTMMNILLVTFILLFTFTSNSQTTFGGVEGEPFEEIHLEESEGVLFWTEAVTNTVNFSRDINSNNDKDFLNFSSPNFLELNSVEFEITNDDNYSLFDLQITFELIYDDGDERITLQKIPTHDDQDIQDGVVKFPSLNLEEITNVDVRIIYGNSFVNPTLNLNYLKFHGVVNNLSLQENNLDQLFKVFSFNDEINIQTTEFKNYDLKVYNMYGGLVTENTNLSGDFKKNISESGIYIVKLQFENEILTRKILIK